MYIQNVDIYPHQSKTISLQSPVFSCFLICNLEFELFLKTEFSYSWGSFLGGPITKFLEQVSVWFLLAENLQSFEQNVCVCVWGFLFSGNVSKIRKCDGSLPFFCCVLGGPVPLPVMKFTNVFF